MTVELQSRLRLGGARADSLLGYLKAIATLRLFSTQMDNTVRAAWSAARSRCTRFRGIVS
jgi:hypothetical protein